MRRVITTWMPFVVVACVALWWVGALEWIAPPEFATTVPAEREPAVAPPITETPPTALGPTGPETWPLYHGESALTGAVAVTLPNTLGLRWTYQSPGPIYAPPVASRDSMYFSTSDGWIVALDRRGAEVWARQITRDSGTGKGPVEERFEAPIACYGSTVFLGSSYGILYALDAAKGETLWTFDMDGPILGTANVYKGDDDQVRLIVIDQDDGSLQCLDADRGTPLWRTEGIGRCDGSPSVTDGRITFGSCAAALHVFAARDGSFQRNVELGDDSQVAGGVALVADSAFCGSQSGKVFHANVESGAILWTNQDADGEVFTTPAVDDEWVVFGSLDGVVYALGRTTGKTMWEFETTGEPSSPLIAGDKVLVSSAGTLYMLRRDTGEELWSYDVSDTITAPSIVWGMVVVGSQDGSITAFG